VKVAQKRIDAVAESDSVAVKVEKPKQARVPFGALLENGLILPGQTLFFIEKGIRAKVLANGHIKHKDITGSIHGVAKALTNGSPINGWDVWFYKDENGKKIAIDELRKTFRKRR
jgi:modification methylase